MRPVPSLIFLDANIPMYAAGAAHSLKVPCRYILEELVPRNPIVFFTDAEVLQEMLHRYRSSASPELGYAALSEFARTMSERIEPVLAGDVLRAATLAPSYARLSARDLIHLAVMGRLGVERMASADAGFDGIAWLTRLDPLRLDLWVSTVGR